MKQAVSDLERRHFSSWRVQFGAPPFPDCPAPHRRWRVQFGAPPFPDCPAPHRKVQENQWVARRRTWVPPLVVDRSGIASRFCPCRHRRSISTLRGAGPTAPPPKAVAKLAGRPPPQGEKGPFPDGNWIEEAGSSCFLLHAQSLWMKSQKKCYLYPRV